MYANVRTSLFEQRRSIEIKRIDHCALWFVLGNARTKPFSILTFVMAHAAAAAVDAPKIITLHEACLASVGKPLLRPLIGAVGIHFTIRCSSLMEANSVRLMFAQRNE